MPHLRGAGGGAGQVLDSAGPVVAVDWRLDGASLHLRANLSDQSNRAPAAPGRLIWGGGRDDTALGPWQVRVSKSRS